ncbi:hypothetical protein O3M35_003908 [Rhynocoris fuscipes]|uniref:Farnesyl pyrophosphate synthase n=1 Tax=Rhynocoris fuscipes TaxID=488301 RepID=A0AAW1CI16_9HEMI
MSLYRAIFRSLKTLPSISNDNILLMNSKVNLSSNVFIKYNGFRCASTITSNTKVLTKDDRRDLMAVFPDIVRELSETDIHELNVLYAKILQYNVSSGKKERGLALISSYKILAQPQHLTEKNLRLSQILAWAVEMLQAHFIVCDDLMDNSEMRRGRPCWYRLPEVGFRAINDALYIQSAMYQLLKNHFSKKPYYHEMLELFRSTVAKTISGQTLDINTRNIKTFAKRYTMDRYTTITRLKTSYYTYHLPVALAMLQAGIVDNELHRQAKSILLEMGRYFQVQDDYLDVFGDSKETGKIGTDIQDGKCSWLAVVALHKANDKQRALFEECYGSQDENKIQAIKDLYIKLDLPALYAAFEEETYNLIFTQIQQISQGLPHELFLSMLNRLHKRQK